MLFAGFGVRPQPAPTRVCRSRRFWSCSIPHCPRHSCTLSLFFFFSSLFSSPISLSHSYSTVWLLIVFTAHYSFSPGLSPHNHYDSGNYTCFIERGGELLDSISYSLRVQGGVLLLLLLLLLLQLFLLLFSTIIKEVCFALPKSKFYSHS